MYFDTFAEFLQMGKHGFYVWLAYGATGLVLLWSWMSARSMLAGVEKQLTEQAEISARMCASARECELGMAAWATAQLVTHVEAPDGASILRIIF